MTSDAASPDAPDSPTPGGAPTPPTSPASAGGGTGGRRKRRTRVRRWLSGPEGPRTYVLSRWLFERLVGLAFVCAFASAWWQVEGCLGAEGVLPAAELAAWAEQEEPSLQRFPTLLRGDLPEGAPWALCAAGTAVSVLLVVGLVPRLAILAAGVLYLSLVASGRELFSFQWDALLLETALVALLLAPGSLLSRPLDARPPSAAALLAARVLLFKLMFLSGWVKLGDAEWESLTALEYHLWTQPLPTALAWYAHRLPAWLLRASVAGTLAVELALPFLVLGPRRLRMLAGLGFVALMVGIGVTGNYNFFNILSVALCVPLFDDAALLRLLPARARSRIGTPRPRPRAPAWLRTPGNAAAVVLALLSLAIVARKVAEWEPPSQVVSLQRALGTLRLSNSYGLFADMTTERFEIRIEGSEDGETWRPYVFPWKPGPLGRRPGFCAPHQPRLDWQMWFAALPDRTGERPIPWTARPFFPRLCLRLLEGSPAVEALLEEVPFDEPPRYLRATWSAYRFTSPSERAETGRWWRRGESHAHTPVLTLRGGRLAAVR